MGWIARLAVLGATSAFAAGAVYAFANEPALQSLYSALVSEAGVRLERNVAYGNHPRHALDIYHANGDDGRAPIAFFVYGGSWRYGHRSVYGFVGAALATRGITTVIPDYRLFPEVRFPSFVEDAAAAYAWTAKTIARGRPIVLVGHSAGAHIAALLAYDGRYLAGAGDNVPKPVGFVGLAGPYAFDPKTWPSTAEIFATAKTADVARPVSFAQPSAPPALLMHGRADDLVKLWNMREMAAALDRHGVAARTNELQGIGHLGIVLAISRPFRWRTPVLDDTVGFIRSLEQNVQARSPS